MLIPPKYKLTSAISQSLQTIEASKSVINAITIPPEIEINIRRAATLKSSLFSARIEGNPLTLDDLPQRASNDQKKREIFNIMKATEFIHQRETRDITISTLLQMHQKIMNGLIDKKNTGCLRNEISAIFNSAGIAIYLTPPPSLVPELLNQLIKFINSNKEPFIPIKAVLAHYIFEKIHPFLDGNGRVGRLLIQAILTKNNSGMKGLLNIEEYLDNNRTEYYDGLMEPEKNVTEYVGFMLKAISSTADKAKQIVLAKQKIKAEDYLLPRRAEILQIIKEQKLINLDSIKRRFPKINERTLRYDLKKLTEAGLIKKRGVTKGVYYETMLNTRKNNQS